MVGFLYGGNTGVKSADELARKREIVNALLDPSMTMPQTFGEGLTTFGRAIAGRLKDKKLGKQEDAERARVAGQFDTVTAGLMGGQPTGGSPAGGGGYSSTPAPRDPLAPINIAGDTMSALGKDSGTAGYRASLVGTESGGNWQAANNETGAGGKRGHFGRVQFGHARLQEAMDAGAIPQGTTPEQFMASPALQISAENWHFGDLESKLGDLVGTTVNGKPLDMGALVAMGHLGGAGGARKFVESGGAYNPSDSFGTSLAEYAATHGGTGMPGQPADQATMSASGPGPNDVAALSEMAANPYLPEGQRAVVNALLQQAMTPPDPMAALEMEKAQLELAQMKNPTPEPGFTQLSADEVAGLGLPPGVYQRGPDGRIDTIEKTQGPADPIADLKARATAAGLTEGTPEYQQFMLNNGKTPEGMTIESDGQGGFRMVQGAGAATAKPFTEGQSKDVVYATRAQGALEALDPIAGTLTDRGDVAAGWLPMGLGGGMQNSDYQVAKTAGDEFLQAILRKDTGAAITADEQVLYGETYLPRPGDSPERLAYKAEARKRAVAAIEAGMSPAQIVAQERALASGGAQPAPAAAPAANVPKGVDPADWEFMTPEERALFQ